MHLTSASIAAVLAVVATGNGLANEGPRRDIRICLQFIEVPHPTLTEMTAGTAASGAKIHTQAMALIRSGAAKMLETCILSSPQGQKATVESIREIIYPTELETGGLGSITPQHLDPAPVQSIPSTIRPDLFLGWETRKAGVSIEIEPTLAHDGKSIDLRFVAEIVDPIGFVTWVEYVDEWGDCSTRLPTFNTLRTNTDITLTPGTFELAAVLTPKPTAPTPATLRKILVFVRADMVQQRKP